MSFTYLITSQDIEWLDDYDDKKVNSIIKDVQLEKVRPAFPNYYEYLVEKVENGNVNRQDEKILDEYIKPIMSKLCEAKLHLKSPFKITQTGTNVELGEDYERGTSGERQAIITDLHQGADTIQRGMIMYMSANLAIYPSFKNDYNDCYSDDVEETFNMSTVHGFYRQSSIYGRNRIK